MENANKARHSSGYRRMLVDMHIGDWDENFLSRYDPRALVELYEQAGLTSVMFYCQSHVGLCYWPTKTGKMHEGLKGRDVVGETLRCLRSRNIGCCGYYSVIYNNWAFLEHPEWRIQPAGVISDGSFAGDRYGHCCPNNPGYRAFVMAQLDELVGPYDFDGFFFDMTFWPAICLCEHCRRRYREEVGGEIPHSINWISPDWCRFQSARERWMSEFAGELSARVKRAKPDITAYHNFAAAMFNWTLGLPFSSSVHHDILGADFYGDSVEQLLVSKLMTRLTPGKPIEFMTSRCVNLRDHVRLKKYEEMEIQAFAATLFSSAMMFIDAINIDGTVNPAIYDRIGRIFAETTPYEPYLGGTEMADVAVYFSSDSKMDFAEQGLPLDKAPMWGNDYPHVQAVRGMCRILQQDHIPFTVITARELPELSRYRVIVLPNVLRMNQEEVIAFRDYVRNGGRIYASRYTSLTETSGVRHNDFMMSDIFGCHFSADDLGRITYLKPANAEIAECVAPQDYVSQFPLSSNLTNIGGSSAGMLRLDTQAAGEVLATLTLPYADPEMGTVFDGKWASIHSSPPWNDTDSPTMVRHRFGDGECIYSAADIESVDGEVNNKLMSMLILSMRDAHPSCTLDAHPAVWMTVFHQPENSRFLIGFLNYQSQLPAIPFQNLKLTLRGLPGKRFTSLESVPENEEISFETDPNGVLHASIESLQVFHMLTANYAS